MLDEIYSEILLENSRIKEKKVNKKSESEIKEKNIYHGLGINSSCGDDITLYIQIKDNYIIKAEFTGEACAICEASSNILCKRIENKEVNDVKKYISKFKSFMLDLKEKEITEKELSYLGEAYCFKGIRFMPSRIKCVMLPYNTLNEIIESKF